MVLAGLAVMSAASSCQLDSFWGDSGSNRIGLQVQGSDMTKAASSDEEGELLCSVPFDTDNGEHLVLSVYLSDFPEESPATKGTPVTTGNIGLTDGFGTFRTSAWLNGSPYVDPAMQSMADVEAVFDSENSEWTLDGGPYYWPEESSARITFCSFAPESYLDTYVEDLVWDSSDRSATFSFTQPAASSGPAYSDAALQKDLILAIDPGQHKESNVRGGESYAQIHFYHALAGVRFTRGAELNHCKILNVVMENFYSSASATFSYNSSGKGEFEWIGHNSVRTFRQSFNSVILDDADTDLDGESGIKVVRGDDDTPGGSVDPTSYITDAYNRDQYTFLMIPQELPSEAAILIYVKDRLHPIELAIGSLPTDTGNAITDENNRRLKDWSTYAGKMLTLKIESEKMDLVRVKVDDTVSGIQKSDVLTANTGRNGVFMRVALVANGLDNQGDILRSFFIGDIYSTAALPAYLVGFSFPGSCFTKESDVTDYWKYCEEDGFYYYKYIVPSGKKTARPIFNTFTAPLSVFGPIGETGSVDVTDIDFDVVLQGIDAGPGPYTKDYVTAANWPSDIVTDWLDATANYAEM